MVGQNLAHYKILEKIGSGGMGAVYLAKDTKLDRNVALKILPPELAENEERRSRFTREAKAIAALNHPNIVTVYSVEEADSIHFILFVQSQLKIIPPVASIKTVIRQHWIFKENTQALEIMINAVQYNDVGCDHQKVP